LKLAGAGAAVLVLAAAWWALFGFLRLGRPADPPLPDPNGYDDLVRAAGLVPDDKVLRVGVKIEDLSADDLRQAVASSAKALEAARIGIGRECLRPRADAFDVSHGSVQRHLALGKLANAFEVEAALARREGKLGDAARSFGDLTLLGAQVSRGGVYIHFLISTAIGMRAMYGIANLREKLDGSACRESIAALERAAALQEPFEAIAEREREFAARNGTILERLEAVLTGANTWDSIIADRRKQHGALSALLLADLSARAYRAERGQWPASLADIVPGCLKAVPVDPHSGKPLAYRIAGDRFVLYSVGEDGKDDGGTPGKDLFLDDFIPKPEPPAEEAEPAEEER